jgi:hypothetical protein
MWIAWRALSIRCAVRGMLNIPAIRQAHSQPQIVSLKLPKIFEICSLTTPVLLPTSHSRPAPARPHLEAPRRTEPRARPRPLS